MITPLTDLLERYHARETVDHRWFQPRARLLQSIWREEHGYEPHRSGGKVYGARLAMPWAKETLANYLTDTIREVVRREVLEADPSRGRLFGEPRIWNNLLSSQPLCFNLFGELRRDPELATDVVRDLTAGRVDEVTRVRFEYSPGRGERRYTGDHSAFDVFLETLTPAGERGFVGIEVKYHENLQGDPADHRPRYDEVAREMDCFAPDDIPTVKQAPLQQIWRDHLLAGAMLEADDFADGFFVFLYPERNEYCTEAVADYRACLSDSHTFATWTLEDVHDSLAAASDAPWLDRFHDRYLDFDRIDALRSDE